MTVQRETSFTDVFSAALRGVPCDVVGLPSGVEALPVQEWVREPDAVDLALLRHCVGSTLDVGCGPGRMAATLAADGRTVLGVDVVHEAVEQTRRRGADALLADVFAAIPGEGTWDTVLLADGNIGIGGDPAALLTRAAELASPDGRVVVELAPRGVKAHTTWAHLVGDEIRSRPFRWAVLGLDDIAAVAEEAGLRVLERLALGGRWAAVLVRR